MEGGTRREGWREGKRDEEGDRERRMGKSL
jgi:hypothetical protein